MDTVLTSASNAFAFKIAGLLFQQDAGQNVFFSPYSISAALSMTMNGSRGDTLTAMQHALQVQGMHLEQINQGYADLSASLKSHPADIQLAIANALWGNQSIQFDAGYIQRCSDFYAARIESLDFGSGNAHKIINQWVEEQTRQRIQNLIKPEDLNILTLLVLTNAIYFKGTWKSQFNPQHTAERTFHLPDGEKQWPLMAISASFPYLEAPGFQAASLPYGDGRFSMVVFLPAKKSSLAAFTSQLNAANWDAWRQQLKPTKINLMLPRFRVDYEKKLNESLTTLGMGIAFGGGADFSGISSKPAYISVVRHKAFLEVNEEGSEAAAATAVIVTRGALHPTPRMIVDRPFFCAICDNQSGAILFMGCVVDPQ